MISDPSTASTTINNDPFQAAQRLGNVLSETPEYRAFVAASKAIHNDVTVQKLSAEMRSHQTALHWDRDPNGQHAAELARLELQIEEMPVFKEYREREKVVSALFEAVDKTISQEAGLDFAVNAQHTGCSCGG
jgi:cell fate (sporulation/competence/biofilm development) regulator YlbF (YheA/YmcA/DUF963 family)